MSYSPLFAKCLSVVLKSEGGYSNHPLDSGHATMKGVTQAVYDSYRLKNNLPTNPVIDITDEEIDDIYYSMYWNPMRVEQIDNEELVLHVFDHGVNAGAFTSVKMLQRLVGETDDGVIGQKTLRAIREFNGNVVDEFIKRRKLFYVTLVQRKPELRIFMKGWLNRIEHTKF
jgi:lysozyme family protein